MTVNFRRRKIFRENLNEAISLVEIDVILKGTSISTNERNFLKRNLTLRFLRCKRLSRRLSHQGDKKIKESSKRLIDMFHCS